MKGYKLCQAAETSCRKLSGSKLLIHVVKTIPREHTVEIDRSVPFYPLRISMPQRPLDPRCDNISSARVMQEVYTREPERFIRGVPKVPMPPKKVWINNQDDPQATQKIVTEKSDRQTRNFVLKRDQYQAV